MNNRMGRVYCRSCLFFLACICPIIVFSSYLRCTSFFQFPPLTLFPSNPKTAHALSKTQRADSQRSGAAIIDIFAPKRKNEFRVTEKSGLEKVEDGLSRARAAIRRAALSRSFTVSQKNGSFVPRGSIYRNSYAFYQSYMEMEKRLKIFVYKEGELPLVHDGPCNEIYSIEGQVINELDQYRPFVTENPREAVVHFLPISITKIVHFLYRPGFYDRAPLQRTVADYIQVISTNHPFWNRSKGADHFIISCHDWGPDGTRTNSDLFNNSIRVLCNANVSEGFNPKKDVSIPEIFLKNKKLPEPINPAPPPSSRTILAFFAGGSHGSIRKILLDQWKGKDSQVQVFEYLSRDQNYTEFLLKSKYCLCPSGYEVASPRIPEAIYSGCVPVTISDHYVLPFSDVLNWSRFSVQIPVSRIPEIKEILLGISESSYRKLQKNVMKVQRHFTLNRPAKSFDVMHMTLHSIWLRRLNLKLHQTSTSLNL